MLLRCGGAPSGLCLGRERGHGDGAQTERLAASPVTLGTRGASSGACSRAARRTGPCACTSGTGRPGRFRSGAGHLDVSSALIRQRTASTHLLVAAAEACQALLRKRRGCDVVHRGPPALSVGGGAEGRTRASEFRRSTKFSTRVSRQFGRPSGQRTGRTVYQGGPRRASTGKGVLLYDACSTCKCCPRSPFCLSLETLCGRLSGASHGGRYHRVN